MLIVTWAAYDGNHGNPSRLVLACIDLYMIAALGIFWAYAEGDEFRWAPVLQKGAGIYGLLLLWNLVVGGQALQAPPQSMWRWGWILPSEAMSALALMLLALVFLVRYGPPAAPFACVALPAYAFLQRPTYTSIFFETRDSGWVLALASGKLLYGLLFYTIFFLPARDYSPLRLRQFEMEKTRLVKVAKWVGGAVAGLAVTVASDFLARWIEHLIHPKP
jgi:hypothetical protein